MSLPYPHNLGCFGSCPLATSPDLRLKVAQISNVDVSLFEGHQEQVRKMFDKVDLSVSSYDTAWVAMVPCASPYVQTARFPQCLNWLLNNQSPDGSWGLPDRHHLLMKDALVSTLASVLALKKWGVGEKQIVSGLEFIGSYSPLATAEKQHSPIGFDIVFGGMIELANHLSLNLPLRQSDVDTVLRRRNAELKRCSESFSEGSRAYLSYVSEGMDSRSHDWEMVMKYQRKDGSILNSPSATAAALLNLQNSDCLRYIIALLGKLGDAVPAVYPREIYSRLHLIDDLEKLGVHHHFQDEIGSALADIYKQWLNGQEEIFQDIPTLAIAFRILRCHGYSVSSDCLSRVAEEGDFRNTLQGHLMDMGSVMELYKSSQIIIDRDDIVLEKLHSWTSRVLKERLASGPLHADMLEKHIREEVDLALRFPRRANLERFVNRKNIQRYSTDNARILKSAYRSSKVGNKVLLNLAVEDFNKYQEVHREELEHLQRWAVEKRLDKLKFARQKLAYCYFTAAAALPAPELSGARSSWAKNGYVLTLADDLFDFEGSREETVNLIELTEKWDEYGPADCCSENVEILFSAIQSIIHETGDRAVPWQGRDVKAHVAEIWLDFLKAMMKEAEWSATRSVPGMDEYLPNGSVSIGIPAMVLPTLYLIGPKLSEAAFRSTEMLGLLEAVSSNGRLLNDIQSFNRETEQGKLNAVSLLMIQRGMSKEEAISSIKDSITSNTRELLRQVLGDGGAGKIPRACRDLFWQMNTSAHLFYGDENGFTLENMGEAVKDLLARPIHLREEPRSS